MLARATPSCSRGCRQPARCAFGGRQVSIQVVGAAAASDSMTCSRLSKSRSRKGAQSRRVFLKPRERPGSSRARSRGRSGSTRPPGCCRRLRESLPRVSSLGGQNLEPPRGVRWAARPDSSGRARFAAADRQASPLTPTASPGRRSPHAQGITVNGRIIECSSWDRIWQCHMYIPSRSKRARSRTYPPGGTLTVSFIPPSFSARV